MQIADDVAESLDITREEQDAYALESYRRATRAWDNGYMPVVKIPLPIS